jgi:hypothetical protein
MTNIVTLTRKNSEFSNKPASFAIGDYDDGSDCHLSVEKYVLPEGYRVAMTVMDQPAIYDAEGYACDIVEHVSGLPQLVSCARKMPVLARA